MTPLLQLLAIGGLFILKMAFRLLLLVLFPLCVGLIAATCAAQAFYRLIVDKEYRKNLFESASDKPAP
jgi:glucan phosphoethanolaminetransferase (alkaline phosphatase superfamily)